MSSPSSISYVESTESLGSDVESLVSIGTNDDSCVYHIPEDAHGNKLFELGDGDINICVNGTTFHTHKYLLKRFSVLKRLIEQKATGHEELPLEHDPTDFAKAFKILYSSFIEGIPDFDSVTLVSALRIATAYDYPMLRAFTITKLENAQLSAIERIRIAREFRLTSWEAPAYEELCARDEPITEEEATVLGISDFVQVARIREQHQRKKGESGVRCENVGSELQVVNEAGKASSSECATRLVEDTANSQERKFGTEVESVTTEKPLSDEETDTRTAVPDFKPCFIDKSLEQPRHRVSAFSKSSLRYKVPSCQCHRRTIGALGEVVHRVHCEIPPCVGDAFEQLQVSQIAHSTSITQLESTVQDIKASLLAREPIAVVNNAAALPSEPEFTFVQTEIRKWLTPRT